MVKKDSWPSKNKIPNNGGRNGSMIGKYRTRIAKEIPEDQT